MEHQPKRVLLECTRTWQSSLHTGIERVVRKLLEVSAAVGRERGIECLPVVYQPRLGFVPMEWPPERAPYSGSTKHRKPRLKQNLERLGLIDLARRLKHTTSSNWSRFQHRLMRDRRREFEFGPGDVLLLLDSSWQTPYWRDVQRAQAAGAMVGAVVYDLLPLEDPTSFTPHQCRLFHQWWEKAYWHADFFPAISQSIFEGVRRFDAAHRHRRKELRGGSFRLGVDFVGASAEVEVGHGVRSMFSENSFLSVGTLSPRKNQGWVLDVFEQLWNRGQDVSLCFAGHRGWHSASLIERIQQHPMHGNKLFWREDLSDAELSWCYQNARGLITASRGEGFNLPIVEALHQGCPVFASDIPVHREVGGSFVRYFPLGDTESLAKLLTGEIRRSESERPVSEFRWPTWRESCTELLALIQSLAQPAMQRISA